jgi:hypothetical protein
MEPEKSDIEELDRPQDAEIVQPRELWEKKFDESPRAYDAFSRYRDSEKRSFKSIADALSCSTQNVWQWSVRHNWKLRCDAYDLHLDQEQRAEFARNRTRMRARHLAVGQAMLNVASYGIREWQARIATGAALNLAPEQIALLTKCAIEIERSTTGEDGEHRPTAINILIGSHRYQDERAGESGEVEREVEWKPLEAAERMEYESLSPQERSGWESWKDPPQKKLTY